MESKQESVSGGIVLSDQVEQMAILLEQGANQLSLPYEAVAGLVQMFMIKDMQSFMTGGIYSLLSGEPIVQFITTRRTFVRADGQTVVKVRQSPENILVSLVGDDQPLSAGPILLRDMSQAMELSSVLDRMIKGKDEVEEYEFEFLDSWPPTT